MFLAHDAHTSSPPTSSVTGYYTYTYQAEPRGGGGIKQRCARTLHGHTHGVLSACAGLAAQYSVRDAAHLHGHTNKARRPLSVRWPRSTILATVRRLAAIHNARRILLLCHVTLSVPFYLFCPQHAPTAFAPFARALHARPPPLLPAGGPSSAPCLSGFWSRHRNTSQLLKRSIAVYLGATRASPPRFDV